tara:strand:+ start:2666 stop:4036 length:1371 start_codon:yes stop_codon:yes gene_type:complete
MELEQTIEELEAEVLRELEEANGADAPKKGAAPAEAKKKINGKTPGGEVQDGGAAVVDPEASSSPTDVAAKGAKEVGSDAQQKGEGSPDKMKKIKKVAEASKDDEEEVEEDEDEDEEEMKEGELPPALKKAMAKKNGKSDDDDEEEVEEAAEMPEKKMTKMEMQNKMVMAMKKMKKSEMEALHAAYEKMGEEEDEDDEEVAEANLAKAKVEEHIKSISVEEDVAALVDGEELSEEFKAKAATIFEAAVKSKTRDEVTRIHSDLTEEFASKVEVVTEDLSDKVDTYLNYVVEEWTKENELAIERGLKGEIAEDFISGLKQLFEDHYIDVPDEKYDVLEAQSEKISELEEKVNSVMEANVALKQNNGVLVRESVISEVSEDLADTEIEKFKSLTEDVDFVDEESFKAKLDTLKESYFPKTVVEQKFDDEAGGTAQDIDTTGAMSAYMSAISRNQQRAQ